MARESKAHQALFDTCRSSRLRAQNARMRSEACIADSLALIERARRSYAPQGVGQRASNTRTEFVADATQAFSDRAAVQRASLTELERHLERIRAQREAIAALQGRFHSVKRNC